MKLRQDLVAIIYALISYARSTVYAFRALRTPESTLAVRPSLIFSQRHSFSLFL
jgi:hypothetical protein